jgi:chemotaxis protein methyltransferase WspC
MNNDPRLISWLKERIGLDIGSIGISAVERASRQRHTATGLQDANAYWELLQGSGDEQQALIEAVVVPETWFFRYPESFRTLAKLALQRAGAVGRPLRLLSAPCSSGEEPYSIAMALLDAGFAPERFSVEALDISAHQLVRASAGLYGRNSFRGEHLDFRPRHFSETDRGYQLSAAVRARVRFRTGNLLNPGWLAAEPPFDFVFCRNLLIYFDAATQAVALKTLVSLTQTDGFLFVGPAEASLLSQHGLEAMGLAQSFAFRQATPAEAREKSAGTAARAATPASMQVKTPATTLATTLATTAVKTPVKTPGKTPHKSTSRTPAKAAQPALASAGEGLDDIAALANRGRTAEALAACDRLLVQQGPSAALFYWFGLLNDAAGRAAAAQEYYRKALYLDPQHRESLAHLAALLEARGDHSGARRLQERAARGVKHG